MADVENQTASSVTTGSAATPQSHAKKEKKRRIPGRNRPILRHPRWSTTPSRDSRNAEDRLFRPSKVRRRKLQSRRRKVAPFIKKYLKGAVASDLWFRRKVRARRFVQARLVHLRWCQSRLRLRQEETRFVRRIQDEKIIRQTYRRRDDFRQGFLEDSQKQASPKRRRLLPKEERRRCLRRRSESQEIGRLLGRKEN
ncbi:unnamed protein product [Tenebrio molitor]|nr:unnamed protein product [Tenebrio molitor]